MSAEMVNLWLTLTYGRWRTPTGLLADFSFIHATGPAPTVTALSQTISDLLEKINADRLKSHVLRSNTASLRLHKRLGFEIEKESEIAIAFSADCAPLLRLLGASRRLANERQLSALPD
ncbi:hypothetical protein [Pelagibacterium sp. H642]|uniref:hypothetical protein n=1 Tax=Pelagibacterium sp. H642 TaxID=1881069 RepID=UPI0028152B9D|nr:hypothetical protein [Pelagibacterium sp. H642]WMT92682.1 hypothetical protein NO934_20315 [Pelagibacterium sp. H642]